MADASESETRSPRSAWLLLFGAALGLLLASAGLLEPANGGGAGLPEDAAATVGERKIRRVDYERVLAGVAGDLRNPVGRRVASVAAGQDQQQNRPSPPHRPSRRASP